MHPKNDQTCGWLTSLPKRPPTPTLSDPIQADWIIIGGGYTGLSAARKLAQLKPLDRIVILEADCAAEGASARNSGYLVDSTLNDGHLSDAGLENFRSKYELNRQALETVRHFVNEHRVDCDWNECGKFHATSLEKNEEKLLNFSSTLTNCGIAHDVLFEPELSKRLGTVYYRSAVRTNGGVMLQPAKLARAMIDQLPFSVELYEQTPVLSWQKHNDMFECTTPKANVTGKNLLVCNNGFMASLGINTDRAFPLTLTASLTRPLTHEEYETIGSPEEWGVLSAQAMGATVRLTGDRRIMIRNTAEAFKPINMTPADLAKRRNIHYQGLLRRFPFLPEDAIETTWSGVTCISGNSANIFQQYDDNLFVAGCYNGGGIGLATLFGEQLAFKAVGERTSLMDKIEARPSPNWLPPQPFLRWGVKARLAKDRVFARKER